MIELKGLPVGVTQAHWYYGPEYMVRVSKPDAARLTHMTLMSSKPLPALGYSLVLYDLNRGPARHILELQNISGNMFLASWNTKIKDWEEIFGVKVVV